MSEPASSPSEPAQPAVPENDLELTVVIPCLNEADTVEICIQKAWRAMRENDIPGEVVVSDNGSTDDSVEIAERNGARVVHVAEPGYGAALIGGIKAARARYVMMGDADDSYDWLELPKFVFEAREGYDLVQGCRLPAGGGTILPGAMPVLHQWGNPMLTAMVKRMFGSKVNDIYCGLRLFTPELFERLDLRCTGMEFATEMIIKATLYEASISQVPITLHPDGRKSHGPHLRTFRDGWRTVRFFLMYSPRWLFLLPGLIMIALGAVGYALALPQTTVFGATLGAHTLLVASLSILLGYQSILFAIFTKTFAITEGLMPPDDRMTRFFEVATLERGLTLGAGAFAAGLLLIARVAGQWWDIGFGALDYAETMRWVIPGVTLSALGFQTVFSGFFVSILGMARR